MANIIQANHIGFKRAIGSVPNDGILRKYELNYTPNDALIEELRSKLDAGFQNSHFFYKIRGTDLYILARNEEALENIDEALKELAAEITAALKVRRMLTLVE